ncbi:MAG: peptide chain release factor N(5)-glutamine methyltransferase [Oscillospiraceae bacterium]
MVTMTKVFNDLTQLLAQNPNADPRLESQLLFEFVTGKPRRQQEADFAVTQEQWEKLAELAQKRIEGYPIQYILGKWQFFDLELLVGEGVLIPRCDTEAVCEEAFKIIGEMENPNILDLCSGSGAIALAIKKRFPKATVAALEKSDAAYEYLEKNIEYNRLTVLAIKGDVFLFDENIEDESFEVIISNPPYISEKQMENLQKEVTYEPKMALFAADHGLRFYKFIAKNYRDKLKEKGYLIFEYGFDQQEWVKGILLDEGYRIVSEFKDLEGNNRGVVAQK